MFFIGRIFKSVVEGASGEKATYHYEKPLNERIGNGIFKFWGRMMVFSMVAPILVWGPSTCMGKRSERIAEPVPETVPYTSPSNPWALDQAE